MSDNLQERNQQVLSNISQLQAQEKQLYNSLEDASISPDQKQIIINKINEISQMRINLYAGIKDMYSSYQKNVSASSNTLAQETMAIDIIENELNEAKKKLNLIQEEKYNKLRTVEINTYYGKRYGAHTQIMKIIVIICIPLIILALLAHRGILPPKFYMLLASIVLIVGIIILCRQLIDLSNRDNMNWDEYNWYFNTAAAPSPTSTDNGNPWETQPITCVGSACCYEGSTYDAIKNMCVPINVYEQDYPESTTPESTTPESTTPESTTNTSVTTESFVSGKVLGKYASTQIKPFTLSDNIMPTDASLLKF